MIVNNKFFSIFFRSISIFTIICLCFSLNIILTSCGEDKSTVNNTFKANSGVFPNLLQSQASRIYQESVEILNNYYKTGDETELINRATIEELPLMRSERNSIKSGDVPYNELALNSSVKQYIISKSASWPRAFIVISTNSDETLSNVVAFKQSNIYENYKICSRFKVFENTELPKFEIPMNGSVQMNEYDKDLKLDILTTVNQYTDILNKENASPYANNFLIDKFQKEIKNSHSEANNQLSILGGSSAEIFTPNNKNITAMKTYNSGAFVIAQINSVWNRSGNDRIYATPSSPSEKALFNNLGISLSKNISVGYTNFVAFYIPPKSVNDDILVLGADRYPVNVSVN